MTDQRKDTSHEEEKGTLGFSPGRWLVGLVNGQLLQGEGMVKNVPFMLYIVFLILVYLGYGYYAESSLRTLMETDTQLKEKKAEYVTYKSNLEQKKLQSKIAHSIKDQGIYESTTSPYLIKTEAYKESLD